MTRWPLTVITLAILLIAAVRSAWSLPSSLRTLTDGVPSNWKIGKKSSTIWILVISRVFNGTVISMVYVKASSRFSIVNSFWPFTCLSSDGVSPGGVTVTLLDGIAPFPTSIVAVLSTIAFGCACIYAVISSILASKVRITVLPTSALTLSTEVKPKVIILLLSRVKTSASSFASKVYTLSPTVTLTLVRSIVSDGSTGSSNKNCVHPSTVLIGTSTLYVKVSSPADKLTCRRSFSSLSDTDFTGTVSPGTLFTQIRVSGVAWSFVISKVIGVSSKT